MRGTLAQRVTLFKSRGKKTDKFMGKHAWCVCAIVEEIVVLSLEEICIAEKQQNEQRTPVLQTVSPDFLVSDIWVVLINNNNSSLVFIKLTYLILTATQH